MPPKKEEEQFKSLQAASPFSQTPSLRFPETAGATVGMGVGAQARPTVTETASPTSLTIQTPFGMVSSSTGMPQPTFEMSNSGLRGVLPETNADNRAMTMAQMSERGGAISQRLGQESTNRYYAFRQGLEERRAQELLTPSAYEGGVLGKDRREAAGQALVGAERWGQVAAGGRSAMDRTPVSAFGGEFRQGSMGQFSPIQRPTYTTGGLQSSFTQLPQTRTAQTGVAKTYQGTTSMGTGGTPFSFTPFGTTQQQENDPFQGLRFASSQRRRDTRFTPLPFGLRPQTV